MTYSFGCAVIKCFLQLSEKECRPRVSAINLLAKLWASSLVYFRSTIVLQLLPTPRRLFSVLKNQTIPITFLQCMYCYYHRVFCFWFLDIDGVQTVICSSQHDPVFSSYIRAINILDWIASCLPYFSSYLVVNAFFMRESLYLYFDVCVDG